MKKRLLLSALFIFACSSDDNDSNTNGSDDNSFNPPTWIQGVWLNDIGGGLSSIGFEFRDDDVCNVTFGGNSCYKAIIELYDDAPNWNTNVYEEISDSRYYFVFTNGPSEYTHEFEKVSENTINYILYPSNQVIVITKQ